MKVAFKYDSEIKLGKVLDIRNGNDQDYDWKEYLIKYSVFRKPVWIPWWFVWEGDRLNNKMR